MRTRSLKKLEKKKEEKVSRIICETINKIKDSQSIVDRKLEELSRYCMEKSYKIKD